MSVDSAPRQLPAWALASGAAAVVTAGAAWWVAAAPQPLPDAAPRGYPAIVGEPAGEGEPALEYERVPEERGLFGAAPGVLLETHETLADDEAISWAGAETGVTYRLRFVCHGDGQVITVIGTPYGEEARFHACSPAVGTVEFDGVKGAPVRVVREGGEALVGVQVAVAG